MSAGRAPAPDNPARDEGVATHKPVVRLGEGPRLRDDRYGTLFETAGMPTGLASLGAAYVIVDAGKTSPHHFHRRMEEIYMIVSGCGVMYLDGAEFPVEPGDCISIPAGTVHAIGATRLAPLIAWVAGSPPYLDADDIETDA